MHALLANPRHRLRRGLKAHLAALILTTSTAVSMGVGPSVADLVERSDRAAARSLIKQRADVNAAQADGMTALHWAVRRDDLELAKMLLEAGAHAGVTNRYGVTPIAIACENGNGDMVESLLRRGADPNARLRGGETALMTAARTGRVRPVQALLDHGAEVNATERRGQTSLMWAAAEGHAEVVKLLIQAGADVRARLPDSGFNAFFFAAREGRLEVVRALLDAGMDVNEAMDPRKPSSKGPAKGTSALILALENGHYELAEALLQSGADPNDQRSGFAPMHIMTWVRKPPRGEDLGAPPPAELGAIGSLDFIKRLVKRGANVNLRLSNGRGSPGMFNKKGGTPFLMAAATADLPLMKLLLELGADPNIANADGLTPLIAACGWHVGADQATEVAGEEPEVLEAANLLLRLGADINAVDVNGDTVMHAAALKNLPKVVRFLAEKGAKIEIWNRKDKNGWTPLMIAQGHRPGNFKPSLETIDAIQQVMRSAGVEPPAGDLSTSGGSDYGSPSPKTKP